MLKTRTSIYEERAKKPPTPAKGRGNRNPHNPVQSYTTMMSWLMFQVKGAKGNIPIAAHKLDNRFKDMEGKSLDLRRIHNSTMIAADRVAKALDLLESEIKALSELSKEETRQRARKRSVSVPQPPENS